MAVTGGPDSPDAWRRLVISGLVATIGNLPFWSVVVALPAVQAEFGVDRANASLPYTVVMIGVALGTVVMGRVVDRFGIARPLVVSALALGLGYFAAAQAGSLASFAAVYGVPIGLLGGSIAFGPLIADLSHWFVRRRGLAVSLCAAGNYVAGAIWPPILEYGIAHYGWRTTHVACGVFSLVTLLPLSRALRRRAPAPDPALMASIVRRPVAPLGVSPGTAQVLLCIAGVACCTAMAMPQVHLVAYCGDLGYGPAHGARMLSLMLAMGIISRVSSGAIADRIGGLRTLLLGSLLQLAALLLYTGFDGLVSLYIISALFGLFQGGIVPSYAIIVREYFPAREAATRIGAVITATMLGMALGGWLSGEVFDLTGSYRVAFVNGIGWNLLNLSITVALLWRTGRRLRLAPA